MNIVVDAAAAVFSLLDDGDARARMTSDSAHAPHLIDAEVTHTLRRLERRGDIDAADAELHIGTWQRAGLRRYATVALLGRVWELRHNLTAYDASYVALAEALEYQLVTADARLAAAPGVRCQVLTVRS
ncbi:MAG: type II toxin-antitoxin system VapC family toxin [Acidimicrobiales bacterium]